MKSLTLQIPNRIKNPLSHWKPAETREQDKWFHLLTDNAMDTFYTIFIMKYGISPIVHSLVASWQGYGVNGGS